MTKDTLPKPASMLERELSQETLNAIKAIVLEDQSEALEPDMHNKAHRRAAPLAMDVDPSEMPTQEPAKSARGRPHINMSALKPRFTASLPNVATLRNAITPRRLALVVTLITFVIRPWFLPTVLFVILLLTTFIALLLGPDRVRHYAEVLWQRFERRRPEKAAELRQKTRYRFNRLQKRLDKLPARWTGGLHMPQMQSEAEQSAAETAYAKRMARLAQDRGRQSYT